MATQTRNRRNGTRSARDGTRRGRRKAKEWWPLSSSKLGPSRWSCSEGCPCWVSRRVSGLSRYSCSSCRAQPWGGAGERRCTEGKGSADRPVDRTRVAQARTQAVQHAHPTTFEFRGGQGYRTVAAKNLTRQLKKRAETPTSRSSAERAGRRRGRPGDGTVRRFVQQLSTADRSQSPETRGIARPGRGGALKSGLPRLRVAPSTTCESGKQGIGAACFRARE